MIEEVRTGRYTVIEEKIYRLVAYRATKENGDSRKFPCREEAEEWLNFIES